MSKVGKITIGLSAAFIIGLIAVFFFLRHLITKSFPLTNGSLRVPGLHRPVEVYRDDYSVPHINAADEHDLMFTAGYVQAQDRLWQMDLMRRAGEGRLSEILGPSTIEYDKLFRTLDLVRVSQEIAVKLHPETRVLLQDYSSGVNAFITDHKGLYPVEFDMLNYEPEAWEPAHSILISRLMAWDLNIAWWSDLTYGEIAGSVSQEKFKEIVGTWPDSDGVLVPSPFLKKTLSDMHSFLQVDRSFRNMFQLGSLEAGSNAWAVDSTKSISGKPMLANDPHLEIHAPSRWYEIHLSAPGWNVAGVSLPGIPTVVIGHNDHLAWGLTNAMIDDADFYLERVDSSNPSYYLYQKKAFPFVEHEEKILVKGADSLVFNVRATRHGPIINDVHPQSGHHHDDFANHPPLLAMRWTGLDISDEVYGFYLLNKATTPAEFEIGVKEISVPGQSVVYADTKGNIAYWTTGKIPIRGKQSPMLPMEGWTGENDWQGMIPFSRMPKRMNPREGFIVSANQKLVENAYPYYISTLWEPPSRMVRINELLRSAEKFSPEDFKRFQQDIYSPYARDLVKRLLAVYRDSMNTEIATTEALNYLRNWDYRFAQTDIATTIFNSLFIHLLKNIYEDEMGEEVFHDFAFSSAIPYRVTAQLLSSDSSSWFDDVRTGQHETKEDILRKSLDDALQDLGTQLGGQMKNWRWGTLHTVTFRHPFGSRKPLDNIFNIGPFPMSGGGTTVNRSEYRLTDPYVVTIGASMRQIVDLARPDEAWIVITSGQSGQPLNQHYDDQTPLWLNGGYHQVFTRWEIIKRQSQNLLILQP